jgi:uncharacterized membrane protein
VALNWPGDLVFLILPMLLIGLFILIVAKLVAPGSSSGRVTSPGLEVLEERYARGEITRDEFLERKAVLTGDSAGAL